MRIGTKYRATSLETKAHKTVANIADANNAFTNQCCALIICAYYKIINAKKLKNNWDEETITQHLKKHLKLCIRDAELQYFLAPEYPEDDDDIEEGRKNVKKLIYFDLVFSSFNNRELFYIGVEAKVLIENNFLKRIASTELAEYISAKGMRKFIEGIYQKRGIMVGYVVEGNPTVIVDKINKRIINDTFYTNSERLTKSDRLAEYEHSYESDHKPRLNYLLPHLLLDFSK